MNRVPAPLFAVSVDGTIFVNAAGFDDVATPQEILTRALAEPGEIFIGVALDKEDMKIVTPRIASACREASAFVIGRRQKNARHKK